jgi:hypothetical protein
MSDTDVVLAHLISASSCLQVFTQLNKCPEPHSFSVKHQLVYCTTIHVQVNFLELQEGEGTQDDYSSSKGT